MSLVTTGSRGALISDGIGKPQRAEEGSVYGYI
jgi:hypothetical protein